MRIYSHESVKKEQEHWTIFVFTSQYLLTSSTKFKPKSINKRKLPRFQSHKPSLTGNQHQSKT